MKQFIPETEDQKQTLYTILMCACVVLPIIILAFI